MSAFVSRRLAASILTLVLVLPLSAQSRFATRVVDFSPGPHANPSFGDPARFLGGPQGGGFENGSLDIVVLGVGGHLTAGFDVTLADGPGADLSVAENPLMFSGGVFAEVTFVEVSTDGVQFARFPTRYAGPRGPLPAFGTSPMGTFGGLCGGLPVLANVLSNAIDPFDPVRSGGESFDLADLAQDPLVKSGLVDLGAIHFVRVVDVEAGVHPDAFGNLIWDHGGATGSADMDAVSVLNHTGLVNGTQPVADLRLGADGFLELELSDPDGFSDLDPATLSASIDLRVVRFGVLRKLLKLHASTPQGVVLRSRVPLVGSGFQHVLGVSVRDRSGQLSGDQVVLPG